MLNLVRRIERDHSHSLSLTEGASSVPCQFTLTLPPAEHVVLAAELNRRTAAAAAAAGWWNRTTNRSTDRSTDRTWEGWLRRKRGRRRSRERRLESVASVVAAEDVELRLGRGQEGERKNEKRTDHCWCDDASQWRLNDFRQQGPSLNTFASNDFNVRQFAYAPERGRSLDRNVVFSFVRLRVCVTGISTPCCGDNRQKNFRSSFYSRYRVM